jgi:hypothetical protein
MPCRANFESTNRLSQRGEDEAGGKHLTLGKIQKGVVSDKPTSGQPHREAVPEHNFRLAHPSGTIASKLFEALPIQSLLLLRFEPAVMVSLGLSPMASAGARRSTGTTFASLDHPVIRSIRYTGSIAKATVVPTVPNAWYVPSVDSG